MADANGIIFKNPTLNTWFVGPSVDLTAWNVLTVSDCTEPAFNLEYTYVPATAKWTNGIRSIWKDTLWYMSDGTMTYTAPDNGLNTPPATFTRTLDYPLTITVVGAGATDVNGIYTYEQEYNGKHLWVSPLGGIPLKSLFFDSSFNKWALWTSVLKRYVVDSTDDLPPKTGWAVAVVAPSPAPTLEYTLEPTATVSPTSSTATWVSNNPTTGFVSLTDTLTADFGYVMTFDVQQGVAYPYYKYCTKTAGEVYGTLPEATRENFIFAGWYTLPEGQGTRIAADTELVAAEDATLYAKWVKNVSGKVGCGAMLLSFFTLGIGTDFFCQPLSQRITSMTPRSVLRALPEAS